MDNGVVELWELPENKVYLVLENKTKENLFNAAKSYAGNWNKLNKELNLPLSKSGRTKILESSRFKKTNLGVLKKVLEYLKKNGEQIDYKFIEKSIIAIAPKKNSGPNKSNCLFSPKLPFDFRNKYGAIVISAMLHGGSINSNFHPHYSNFDIGSKKNVVSAFNEIFGNFNFKRSIPESGQQIYFPKIIGYILVYGLGMKQGRKVTNDVKVPRFIFRLSNENKGAFLRQAFDDEGYVHITQRNLSLKLASYKKDKPPNLLEDIKVLLSELEIQAKGPRFNECYCDKSGITATKWTITIFGQKNFERFQNSVGFNINYKKQRLNEIINTLKQPHFLLDEKDNILSESCKKVEGNFGYITSADLALALNRSQVLAKKEIRKLRKSGKLELIQAKYGNSAAKYRIVNL